jgi:hypothetical protein
VRPLTSSALFSFYDQYAEIAADRGKTGRLEDIDIAVLLEVR